MTLTYEKLLTNSSVLKYGPVCVNGSEFKYFDDFGIGYLKNTKNDSDVYDEYYFESYKNREATRIGLLLNSSRIEYTIRSSENSKSVCDIGVGSGAFVKGYDCYGFDVNPYAVSYLKSINKFSNPYETKFDYITMWDVIEHIDCPEDLLTNVNKGVILSTPIYKNREHILTSKHFKPNEHIWYFTDTGIKHYMSLFGFECVTQHNEETLIGRESIGSYFFKRNF